MTGLELIMPVSVTVFNAQVHNYSRMCFSVCKFSKHSPFILQDIERENASLRVQITQIEESLANALDEHKRKESALREELKQSREENHTYTVTLQELRAKLTALQARSPDVGSQ